MWEDNKLFPWSKCYYGLWTGISPISNGLKLKCLDDGFVFVQNCSFSLHKMLTDGLELITVILLSAVWTLILTAPIHFRESIGEHDVMV